MKLKSLRRIFKGSKGVSLVEFSISLPLFLLVILGAMDVVTLQMQNLKIYEIAQEALRAGSVKSVACETGEDTREEAIVEVKEKFTALMQENKYEILDAEPKICLKAINTNQSELKLSFAYKYDCIFCIYPDFLGNDYKVNISQPLESNSGSAYLDSAYICSQDSKCA